MSDPCPRHPRPDPAAEVVAVREMLLRDHGTDYSVSDTEIDAAIEAMRERIGGRRQGRTVLAAEAIARRYQEADR